MANKYVTASKLYDYLQCKHRVWRDVYGPQEEKIKESNPFVELLWKEGINHEERILQKLGELEDISEGSLEERFKKTITALKNGVPLIYQGVIQHENLLGIPDLLKKLPDGQYIPIDIKSGMAFQGINEDEGEEGKQKKHYTVQLCLYADVLNKLGFSKERRGKIIDIDGKETEYDLLGKMSPRAKENWWGFYETTKKHVQFLLENQDRIKPAMAGICKLCPWYLSCKKWCEENQDLSNIFSLGMSKRNTINDDLLVEKIDDLIEVDIKEAMKEKKREKHFLNGIGEKSLQKFIDRAIILTKTKKPVIYTPITFPIVQYELFFDIEDDPTQEFVYMHGVYERKGTEKRYVDFTAKEISQEAEKQAWQNFWNYIDSLPQNDFAVYYYSPHEKTTYKRLQKRYPEVISIEKLDAFFENPNVIDLYNEVILKYTDWPLGSYSLKALAVYLGFKWRDETPSGALSIQWFNNYIETKDEDVLKRILLYNEDDCKATMILKDGIEKLQQKK